MRRTHHATHLYPQGLELNFAKSDGRLVGVVRLQTKGHGVFCMIYIKIKPYNNILKAMPLF
jgi:hypothetical protein